MFRHQLEIQLLEQKHKEEINLYEIQISQLKHLIATQQNKLDHLQIKRNSIAQELKSVMEAQWTEALRIIDNGKTPVTTPTEIRQGSRYPKPVFHINYNSFGLGPKDDLRYQQPEQEKQRESSAETISSNIPVMSTPRNSKEVKDWQDRRSDLHKYIKMVRTVLLTVMCVINIVTFRKLKYI